MPQLAFLVPGPPISQGSLRPYARGGRLWVRHGQPDRIGNYRDRVRDAMQPAYARAVPGWAPFEYLLPITGPVLVQATFLVARPAEHHTGRDRAAAIRLAYADAFPARPDLDKACRALMDALVAAGLLTDDSQVREIVARKRYAAEPGTAVLVEW